MNLAQRLKDLAEGLREEHVSFFFVQDLYVIADEVAELEWRMEALEK